MATDGYELLTSYQYRPETAFEVAGLIMISRLLSTGPIRMHNPEVNDAWSRAGGVAIVDVKVTGK
jgi:hypothetical protein